MLIEATVTFLILISIIFGVVEFSYAFFQWNSATKAVQWGARTAAVSNPVLVELPKLTGLNTVMAGLPYATGDQFVVTCSGQTQKCVCSTGCGGSASYTYDTNAMKPILASMVKAFPRVQEKNVSIKYEYRGLGYAGRPGGPVPTITVSLTGLNFNFILLSAFLKADSIAMPGFATTVTGEDLCLASSCG